MTALRIRAHDLLLALILLAGIAPAATSAAQLWVDPTGDGFLSVQAAVDAAADGDTILVRSGVYEEGTSYNGGAIGLVIDKSVTILGVTGDDDQPVADAGAVQATIVSGAEAPWGANFLVSAPGVTIQGVRLEAVARGNDPSLPDGAINKALEVHSNGFTLAHSVVAPAEGFNFDGVTSTAVYFGDDEPDDLESFTVDGNVLWGGITITNGAGDSGDPRFIVTNNELLGSHFLRVRGQVNGVAWLSRHAGLPSVVSGNDLSGVSGFLLQSWDEDTAFLADRNFIRTLIHRNETGPYAYVTVADGSVRTVEYEEYGGAAPAVFLARKAADLAPLQAGDSLHAADGSTDGQLLVDRGGDGFSSIQSAIDAAADGDTILVRPGVYEEQGTHNGVAIGLVIDKSVTILGVTGDGDQPVADADAVQAIIRSGAEATWGANFLVSAPRVTIQGIRLEAVARGNDPSLPGGAINKAIEVHSDGFTLADSVVAAAEGFNFGGVTSTAVYFGDEEPDDLESFTVDGNVLGGGITITNGAGDSGEAQFAITDNVLLGSHFLRVRGQVDGVAWLSRRAGLPNVVFGNDLAGVTGFLLQSWDRDAAQLADRAFIQALIAGNSTGPWAYVTNADGSVRAVDYEEYGGTAPAVFLVRDADALAPLQPGQLLHTGDTLDADDDGTPDYLDEDDDNDGIRDAKEGDGDSDGDGIPDRLDDDSDEDGIPDATEGVGDSDGDGTPDYLDADSDGDGYSDALEGAGDSDLDGTPDYLDVSLDEDGDGIPDIVEGRSDVDSDRVPAFQDIDSDGDGVPDRLELPGAATDRDGDGVGDGFDVDVTGGVDENGDGIDDAALPDSDADGLNDLFDADQDGDGIPDFVESGAYGFDSDGDGIDDRWDAAMLGSADENGDGIADDASVIDSDADGVPDLRDLDSDRDGVADAAESGAPARSGLLLARAGKSAFAAVPAAIDSDGDQVPDYLDLDSDNDGIGDVAESGGLDVDGDGLLDEGGVITSIPLDTDGDGIPDMRDLDSDGDGVPDIALTAWAALDMDGDGRIDTATDADGDGIADVVDGEPGQPGSRSDNDGDSVPAHRDGDDDDDGLSDVLEGDLDTDGDAAVDRLDRDSDNDGIVDRLEAGLPEPSGLDADLDGIDDAWDASATGGTDADSDGVDDAFADRDSDGDGTSDRLDADSDNDGLSDAYEALLAELAGSDSDGDGIDDAIDVDETGGVDANGDGVDDGLLELRDTDGDGLEDHRDPDSDNDGIEDGAEDGDVNADGVNDRLQHGPGLSPSRGAGGGGAGGLPGLALLALLALVRLASAAPMSRGHVLA